MATTSIRLETSHGPRELQAHPDETIAAVLRRNGVPVASVWTYLRDRLDTVRFVSAEARVGDLPSVPIARVSRNINVIGLAKIERGGSVTSPEAVTEWDFPDPIEGAYGARVHELSREDCVAIVQDAVSRVLKQRQERKLTDSIVVGTSGGGDSNAMLSAMMRSGYVSSAEVPPVMMLGIPDWDTQLENARRVCKGLRLELREVEVEEAARLAGLKSFALTRDEYLRRFPDADMEGLATWLLRKVLGSYARSVGSTTIAIGSNREDILGDSLLRVAQGLPPLTVPFRQVGDLTVMYPLHNVAKKIGDGTHVAYSLDNYEARYASHSAGRSVFYYLAYALSDVLPGLDGTFAEGFRQLAERIGDRGSGMVFDDVLGDFALADAYTTEQRDRWKSFLDAVLE